MLRWITTLFNRRPQSRTPRVALRMEGLERRDVPATRLVVPAAQAIDSVTTFHSVSAALTTAGLNSGDVIQIEAGANPGSLSTLPSLANLTIQGNPTVDDSAFGELDLNGSLFVNACQAGLTFRNLDLLNNSGTLNINARVVMDDVHFKNRFDGTGIVINGTSNVSFRFSKFEDQNSNATASSIPLIDIKPISGSNNSFFNNDFQTDQAHPLIRYSPAALATVTDVFAHNDFESNKGGTTANLFTITGPLSGLTIRNNDFQDDDDFGNGIAVLSNATNIRIADNKFDFDKATTASGSAILFDVGCLTVSNVSLLNNRIETNFSATALNVTATTASLDLRIQGNDFNENRIGVKLSATGCTTLAGVQFGAGNNFRKFVTTASSSQGAIVVNGSSTANITLDRNLFNANPETVIFDKNDSNTNADVIVTNSLSGSPAFVSAMYTQFLGRVGDVTNPGDAGTWVILLGSGGTRSQVVNSIVRSRESLGRIVEDMYNVYLGRTSDDPGKNYWIDRILTGMTEEQVRSLILASPEYNSRNVSNASYVANLYDHLLRRDASAGDIAYWSNQIALRGRQAVALDILRSAEHRSRKIEDYYSELLHRSAAPSEAEVKSWVDSGRDLLELRRSFADTPEFESQG